MKKNSSTTHTPQQPKIQTAQGLQQMLVKAKQSNIDNKETQSCVKEKEDKQKK